MRSRGLTGPRHGSAPRLPTDCGHRRLWVREETSLIRTIPMTKPAQALQPRSHSIKQEGQLLVLHLPPPPPPRPPPLPATEPPLPPKEAHRKEGEWIDRLATRGAGWWQSARLRGPPTACLGPHTASLCLGGVSPAFPLLQMVSCFDCSPHGASPNHRAWHHLQTSRLPASVCQLPGELVGPMAGRSPVPQPGVGGGPALHKAAALRLFAPPAAKGFGKQRGRWQDQREESLCRGLPAHSSHGRAGGDL